MKIAFLANLASIHTVKWVNTLAQKGHEVYAISIDEPKEYIHNNVHKYVLPIKQPLGYYLNTLYLKHILKEIKPDILNAHYASGYGTLARLSGYHPYVLSVWGSDVFDFPFESPLKMGIIRKNLNAADVICSTSEVMKRQTKKLLKKDKKIFVTPFGIDTNIFTPKVSYSEKVKVIGTVKGLSPKYGISTLIRAFKLIEKQNPDCRLVIAGDGPQKKELIELTSTLKINEKCEFLGSVPHDKVPQLLHSFDIYLALSESESFGVAILEASACGLPVIVTNVGGLPEVVENGVTGIIINKDSPDEAANAIVTLMSQKNRRESIGKNGVKRVKALYEWEHCYDTLMKAYNFSLDEHGYCLKGS